MQDLKAFGLLLLSCGAGCVSIDDRTPSTLTRTGDDRYTFAVAVESFATEPRSVTAAIGAREFPMTPLGDGSWQTTANLGPCVQGFELRYLVSYPTLGSTLSTSVEPAGATATLGGLLKWVLPEPKGIKVCSRPSVFRVNDEGHDLDGNPGDGACDANLPGTPGPARCTLKAAINEANFGAGPTTIEVPAGTHTALDMYITDDVVLQGIEPGAEIVTHVSSSVAVTIEVRDLTLRDGIAAYRGSLRLINVSVLDGDPATVHVGVLAGNLLVIERSTIGRNRRIGIDLRGAQAHISDSLIFDNQAGGPDHAGGLSCAAAGATTSQLHVVNSTISGNRGTFGGVAIRNGCTAHFRSVTIAGNETFAVNPEPAAGGLTVYPGGSARLSNTIVADNLNSIDAADPDCGAGVAVGTVEVESLGHNLIGTLGSCRLTALLSRPDLTGLSARLEALAANGGPTQTRLPLADSPALGAGSPDATSDANAAACPHADQRGEPRTGACDIGAVQVSP